MPGWSKEATFKHKTRDDREPWVVFGRNGREHGHEFFLLVNDGMGDGGSTSIPKGDHKAFAAFLRKAADRLDPPSKKEAEVKP